MPNMKKVTKPEANKKVVKKKVKKVVIKKKVSPIIITKLFEELLDRLYTIQEDFEEYVNEKSQKVEMLLFSNLKYSVQIMNKFTEMEISEEQENLIQELYNYEENLVGYVNDYIENHSEENEENFEHDIQVMIDQINSQLSN